MDLATGAMGALLPKLYKLLKEEYNLQSGAREDVEFLRRELGSMYPALRKIGDVPRDQLDEQVKQWAGELTELSYQMEDAVDSFLVRVQGREEAPNSNNPVKQLMEKARDLLKMWRARRQIAGEIKSIKDLVKEVAERRQRFRLDDVVAKPAALDPRIWALRAEATELVGIDGKSQELEKLLSIGDDVPNQKLKMVSLSGFGGLGKTTLVETVYDRIKGRFHCCAFVPVGRNPDVKKVLRDIFIDLTGETDPCLTILDERQLTDKIRKFLEKKRYLIVIDDIWDENLWKAIKRAFPDGDNLGSRLITTTRIIGVSKACCSSSDDLVYPMKHLSDEDSQRLFNRRIFQSERGCPPEFQDVSMEILKKCGGVPLAIISIASLLVSDQQIKSKDEWHLLLKSIGRGLTEDASMEEMQRILLLSYYDLPSHLKSCLLYLSIYPEDSKIWKDELIWKWIAETFLQCEKQETSLFELGEAYFNELINRSLIQPLYNNDYKIEACRVHDVLFDLIRFLSGEENFAAISDGTEDSTSSKIIRRVSIQIGEENHQSTPLAWRFVRSLTVFALVPPLSSFRVLRVLDLKGCMLKRSSLIGVGKLVHLRYLGLAYTGLWDLPEEVGELQFLLVLDVRNNAGLNKLPLSVSKLRRLMCLHLSPNTKLPDGLSHLKSMEVLKVCFVRSLDIIKELRHLSRLRELNIGHCSDYELETPEALADSVCNLHNLQSLVLGTAPTDLLWERWLPPRQLRVLEMPNMSLTWIKINLLHLCNLSELKFPIAKLQQEDLQILGRLPALRSLKVEIFSPMRGLRLRGAHGFRSLIFFKLCSDWLPGHIVFEEGALPKTEIVELNYNLWMAKDDDGNYDFDLGLGNLLSLQRATITLHRRCVPIGKAKEAEAAMRHAADVHPNHPSVEISICPSIPEGAADDEVYSRSRG